MSVLRTISVALAATLAAAPGSALPLTAAERALAFAACAGRYCGRGGAQLAPPSRRLSPAAEARREAFLDAPRRDRTRRRRRRRAPVPPHGHPHRGKGRAGRAPPARGLPRSTPSRRRPRSPPRNAGSPPADLAPRRLSARACALAFPGPGLMYSPHEPHARQSRRPVQEGARRGDARHGGRPRPDRRLLGRSARA